MAGKRITCDGRQYGQRTSVNRWSDELKKKTNKRQLLRIRHAFVESIAGLPVTAVKKRCCVTDTPIVRFPPMQTGVTDTKTTVWTKKMRATVSDIQTAFVFVFRPPVLPTHPYSVRPSALPSNPPSTPLSSFPTFPSSLPPSISPFILLIFPCSVLPYVGPSFRHSFRVPGDSLRARDPPYLPRSVDPFFYTVGLSLGWLVLLTWGTRKGSTTRLFTAMTWRSPSNAYSDREGSSWNKSTESHKNKFSMHSFPYATIRTSREYN